MLRKEGPIEEFTHVILAVGVLLWGLVLFRRPHDVRVVGFLILQVVFLGEEINWGQNYLGFETPAWVVAVNGGHDNGLNFHNNRIGERAFILAVGWALILSPTIGKWRSMPSFTPFEIAVGALSVGVICSIATRVGGLLIGYENAEPRLQELLDLLVAVLMTELARRHCSASMRERRRRERE